MSDELLIPPDESQVEAIKAELGENSERFQNNFTLLEQWVNCQPHLPKNYEENTLVTYLRGCKNDMEKTKKKLEMYFVCKEKFPNLLSVKEFSKKEMAELETVTMAPLPKLTPNGYRVVLYKLNDASLDLFNLNTILRCSWLIGQVRCHKNEHMLAGDVYVIDAEHATPGHIAKFMNLQIKTSLVLLQEAFPARVKALYFINIAPYMEKAIDFIKLFLKQKLKERVITDRGISSLKDIPKECLPAEYGGNQLSTVELMGLWLKYIKDNKEWLEHWEKVKLIGPVPKHIEEKYDFEDLQGIQGRFRKLDFD